MILGMDHLTVSGMIVPISFTSPCSESMTLAAHVRKRNSSMCLRLSTRLCLTVPDHPTPLMGGVSGTAVSRHLRCDLCQPRFGSRTTQDTRGFWRGKVALRLPVPLVRPVHYPINYSLE